ncbi:MAG: amidohydrolase [Rhodospirillaceae bacterium]
MYSFNIEKIARLPLLVFILGTVCFAAQADDPTDTIFFNGIIITLIGSEESVAAEAIAISGDRIVAVGKNEDIRALESPGTKLIDLAGKAMLPGFIDAHGHFPASGLIKNHFVDLSSPPIGTIKTIEDMVIRLRQEAANKNSGEWVQGWGYDDTLVEEMRHPTRWDLDRASTSHPIYIGHISGHLAVGNSLALELAGITKNSPQPFGGKILKDDMTDVPTGVLEEPPAMGRISKLLPKFSEEDMLSALKTAAKAYAAVGVTTAQQGAATMTDANLFVRAYKKGELPIRVHVWPVIQEVAAMIDSGEVLVQPKADGMVSMQAVKGFADGSIQGYTGYLSEPYHSHSHNDPRYRGYPRMDRDALVAQIIKVHSSGYQIAVHGNGDAAIDDVLYAFEQALAVSPRKNTRHIIIHSQMAREDQLERMKAMGIIPSFFNLHTYYWGDRHWDIFMGPERAARMSPTASAVNKGLVFTLHADTPVVPMEPMRIVWAAVNRLSYAGRIIGKEQRISVFEALKGITTYAAYQAFEETEKGTIEAGKLADLVVLDRNPLTVNPLDLDNIAVTLTMVGGKTVFVR